MKLAVGGFLVFASLVSLSACAFMRPVGPCYGYGCSAFAATPSGSSKLVAPDPKAQAKAPANSPSKQGN